jgi:hypothetical protein
VLVVASLEGGFYDASGYPEVGSASKEFELKEWAGVAIKQTDAGFWDRFREVVKHAAAHSFHRKLQHHVTFAAQLITDDVSRERKGKSSREMREEGGDGEVQWKQIELTHRFDV